MKSKKIFSILIATADLKYACGVTTHLFNLLLAITKIQDFDVHLLCTGGDALERFRNLNLTLVIREELKYERRNIINYLKGLVFLFRYIVKNKIKLIHSHNHYIANIAFCISYICNVDTIQSHHNIFPSGGLLKHFKASKHIVVSERIRDYIINNKYANEEDVYLIRYGIKNENLSKKINDIKINVLAISRFIPEKGLDTFIRAVSLLPIEYRCKADFYLAGEGYEESNLIELIRRLKPPIKFLGKIKNSLSLFATNHIFVMTSCWESEGYPLTIIEAGLTNNFIITSDFSGVEEIFENNKDGFIFKRSDAVDLSKKIIMTIDKYRDLTGMINNFREKVERLFNYQKMVGKITQIYKENLR